MSEDDDIKNVQEIVKYSTEQFDKNILFIASGALGVSFAFIKDIVPDLDKAVSKGYLIASWYTFVGVIFISLVAHFVATQAGIWAIKNNHLKYKKYNKKRRPWSYAIRTTTTNHQTQTTHAHQQDESKNPKPENLKKQQKEKSKQKKKVKP